MSAVAMQRHAQLRSDLLHLILAEGFGGLTIADMARRLRCSKSTLYTLGASKEQVIANSVKHFFREAAVVIEERTAAASGGADKIVAYLRAVADGLRPASSAFIADVAAMQPTREIYERNITLARRRVAQLIEDGRREAEFRRVHPAFIADTVAATMQRIQAGAVAQATGLSDAQAFDLLADLVLNGIRAG